MLKRMLTGVLRRAAPGLLAVSLAACAATPTQAPAPAPAAPVEPVVVEPRKVIDGDMLYRLLVAELAGRRGRLDVAMEHYAAAARESDDPRVAERATRIAVYARDTEQAMASAQRWASLAPENPEAHQVIATLYIRQGEVDKAEAELVRVIELTDGGPERGLGVVAALLGREQNHRTGLRVMNQLVERYPDLAIAHYTKAVLADRVGHKSEALAAVDRAIELRPDYTDAIVMRAKVQIDLGRSDQAFADLAAQVKRNPDDRALRLGYARLLVEGGHFDNAAVQLRYLYEHNRDDANLLYALGLLGIESRRLDDAREYLNRVVELGVRPNEAHYYLGRIAENQRQYEEAISHFLRVSGGENQLDAQIRIAEMMARLDRIDEAREHLNKLRVLNPEPTHAVRFYLAEGEVLRQVRRYQDAVDLLTEALEQYPGNVELLYARALTAEKLDREDMFETDLRAVLAREPDNAHALNALGYFLADRTTRFEEARQYIERALELLPTDPAVIDSMGWLHYRLGNYNKALDYLRRAYGKLEDPEIAAHLGEVLWITGDQAGATEIWRQALEQAPEDRSLRRVMQRFSQ